MDNKKFKKAERKNNTAEQNKKVARPMEIFFFL